MIKDLEECLNKAVDWLENSGIVYPSGGARSIYNPIKKSFFNFEGGKTCLLSTAGCTQAFLKIGRLDLAQKSADHILECQLRSSNWLNGAILAGKLSHKIYPSYMGVAIKSLLKVYEAFGEEKYLRGAKNAAFWIIRNMQNSDGSINWIAYLNPKPVLKRINNILSTWQAFNVWGFRRLTELTYDETYINAAVKLTNWLSDQQLPDGSFYQHKYSFTSRIFKRALRGDLKEAFFGCRRRHATSQSLALETFSMQKNYDRAKKVFSWLKNKLSPNGLLYQYYFDNNRHSKEEDVMPTAKFGMVLMNDDFGNCKTLVDKIKKGILYAQIKCKDKERGGGMRGLPGDSIEGENVYCWDTAWAVLFLYKLIKESKSHLNA